MVQLVKSQCPDSSAKKAIHGRPQDLFIMGLFVEEFTGPLKKTIYPTPGAAIQLQMLIPPPPCWTVGTKHSGLKSSPGLRQTVVEQDILKI